MPFQAHLSDKPGTAVYTEFDGPNGTGDKVPAVGAVAYATDNPAVATVDPASGVLAYISVGVANISASDGGNLPAGEQLTIVPNVPVSSTLTIS